MNLFSLERDRPSGESERGSRVDTVVLGNDPLAHLGLNAGMDVPRTRRDRKRRVVILSAAGVVVLVAIVFGLSRLRSAAPALERATVWTDVVRRGPMVREVLGQGALVPQEVRWIAAKSAGRIDRVLVEAGAKVTADQVLLEMSNSDVQLQALEADRQVAQGEAELTNLRATLAAQALAQRSVVASLTADLSDARRRARADGALKRRGFLSDLEGEQTRDHENEVAGRLRFERQRLRAQAAGTAAQLRSHAAEVERLRTIAEFRHKEVEELKIRAGVAGVVQELALQPGQTVAAGGVLAKVARPDRLKGQIRVPETQAKDVQPGQKAAIDTHNGVVAGHVARIDPAAQGGSVLVDVALDGALPAGARPDLNVEGTIEIERLPSVLYVGRPAFGQPGSTVRLFKLDRDGSGAERAAVTLGRTSVKIVEIVSGLVEGDRVILSDMAQWDHVNRIRLQ